MSGFDPSCIDVEDFLDVLEVRNVAAATEDEFVFSCPLPTHGGEDNRPSCYMNKNTTAFFCHGCHAKGNAVHFASKMLEVTYLEATRMLRERYSSAGLDPNSRSMTEEVTKILNHEEEPRTDNIALPDDLLEEFAVDWEAAYEAYEDDNGHPATDYMFDRGFEWLTLHEWGFGYDARSDRIVFPVRDSYGTLIGFKGRSYDGRQPKYLILGDTVGKPARYGFPCYQKSLVVFGLDEYVTYAELLEYGEPAEMIVCEGELNVVKLWQFGYRNAVAINGSYVSDFQLAMIKTWAETAILFFDSLKRDDDNNLVADEAGQSATSTIANLLCPHIRVRIAPDHEGDPASMSPSEVDAMIDGSVGFLASRLVGS
jgi:DNA primase